MTILHLLTDRINWILKFYLNRINFEVHIHLTAEPKVRAVWQRVHYLIHRLTALAARYQAGTLPIPRARRPRTTARPAPATPRIRPPSLSRWLQDAFPPTMPPLSGAIWMLCNDPEIMALAAATPRAGRILRPLCRLIGIKPPAHLQLPPRPRRPRPKAAPKRRAPRPASHPMSGSPANRPAYARPHPHKRE